MCRTFYPTHCYIPLPFGIVNHTPVQIPGEYIIFRQLRNKREIRRQRSRAGVSMGGGEEVGRCGGGVRGGVARSAVRCVLRVVPSRCVGDTAGGG